VNSEAEGDYGIGEGQVLVEITRRHILLLLHDLRFFHHLSVRFFLRRTLIKPVTSQIGEG